MIEKPLFRLAPLFDAVRVIEASHRRIAVVVSENGELLGTLTDGDVRRCLLAGGNLQTPVAEAMNPKPIRATGHSTDGHLLELMRRGGILAIPLVDHTGRFLRLVHLTDLSPEREIDLSSSFAFAVIMAGGEGRRLRPITEKIPKPMVDIGGVPLLERQIERLAKVGLKRIYISVNYLGSLIEDYFGDGSNFGVEVHYLREQEKLGTGGSLTILPEIPTAPIVVMNGDVLTTFDFTSLYEFHCANSVDITVAAVEYLVNVPFGVVQNRGAYVTGLVEKPTQRFLCNAGIYVLSPLVLEQLPLAGAFNMTDLIDRFIASGKPVGVFPVHEYWSDIGTPADLEKARSLFSEKT